MFFNVQRHLYPSTTALFCLGCTFSSTSHALVLLEWCPLSVIDQWVTWHVTLALIGSLCCLSGIMHDHRMLREWYLAHQERSLKTKSQLTKKKKKKKEIDSLIGRSCFFLYHHRNSPAIFSPFLWTCMWQNKESLKRTGSQNPFALGSHLAVAQSHFGRQFDSRRSLLPIFMLVQTSVLFVSTRKGPKEDRSDQNV